MADVSKLKNKGRSSSLGSPPSLDEASNNLSAPEVAPSAPINTETASQALSTSGEIYVRRDARSARRTGRILPFSTRISQEFDQRMRDIAERDGLKLAELLEKSLEAYELLKQK